MRKTRVRDHPTTGEDGLVFEHGAPVFAPRLTRRQKVQRGASALLVVALTAFLLLGGPSDVVTLFHTLGAPADADGRTLPLPTLRHIPLPPSVTALSVQRLNLAAAGSAGVYACWTGPDPATGPGTGTGTGTGTGDSVHLAVLSPTGSVWRDLPEPLDHASECLVTADPTAASALLLSLTGVIAGGIDPGGDCVPPALFYSSDAGHTWVSVPWPQPRLVACTVRASLIEGRIYVHADNPLLPADQIPPSAHGRIIRSDDFGATWHAADTGLPDVDAFGIVGLRPRGRLLVETFDNQNPGDATLWESLSAGAYWTSLGRLPGAFPQVYVADDPAQVANGGWGRLYLSAQTTSTSSPLVAAEWLDTGWTPLPAPPPSISGSAALQVAIAAVGPSGSLLLLRFTMPGTGPALAPPLDIWLWSPARARWREAGFQLPAGALSEDASWSGGTLRLWFLLAGAGTPATPELLALEVPPASVS